MDSHAGSRRTYGPHGPRLAARVYLHDPPLFILKNGEGSVYITSHVDDYIVTGDNKAGIKKAKESIKQRFKMKDLGACKTYLGMEVSRDREGRQIKLTQTAYARKLVEEAGMTDSRSVATPMEAGTQIEPAEKEPVRMEHFRSLVGRIQWLAVVARPDIAHAASQLGSVATKPTEGAWNALKHLLRYLKGSPDVGLLFGGAEIGSAESMKDKLIGYSDANWAEGSSANSTTGVQRWRW